MHTRLGDFLDALGTDAPFPGLLRVDAGLFHQSGDTYQYCGLHKSTPCVEAHRQDSKGRVRL